MKNEITLKNNKINKMTKKEISAGFVIYRPTQEGIKFLILYHRGAYWNFPKGHIEAKEQSLTAALREIREETGLKRSDLKIIPGFKAYEKFYFKKRDLLARTGLPARVDTTRRAGVSAGRSENVFKIVIFYLAKTNQRRINISFEHSGFGWFLYRDAMKILGKYKDSQRVLTQAYDFIRNNNKKRT
jgi:8-oxo-dGTP pyrophosphatase MutT (NUDIX family)